LGSNGWYVSNVSVTATGSDATSGVSVTQTRLNGGAWGGASLTITTDGTHTVEGLATDVAGNQSSVVSATIRRDTVPPVASLNIPTPNGQNGWFVSNPTVSTNASDVTSGVAISQVRVNSGAWDSSAAIGTDGVHTVEGRAQDNAGHWSSVVNGTVRVDTTPPSASVSLPPADGQNGWYISPVTVTAQGSDATSGVASREARLNSGAWQANGLTVSADGTHTVTVRVTDNAGNSQTATATLRRDATPPTIVGADISGTPGNNGWYRSDVEVNGLASDATSGIALIEVDGQPSRTLSDGVHTITIRAVDQAGNQSTQVVTIRVDATPPTLTPQLSPVDGQNGWYIAGTTLDADAGDSLSGLADVRVQINGGTWQDLPVDLFAEGVYDVIIEAEDEAGNLTTRSLTVQIDRTAPTITPSIPTADGNNGWYVSPFEVNFATEDNLAGVQSSAWRLNSGAWQSGTPQIDGEGEIILDIRAVDNAGNERVRRYTFTLDQTPPVGAISLSGEAGIEDWYRSAVEATLTGEDTVSGVAELRLAQTVIETEGWHVVRGEVEDNAGWVREIRRSFGIDLTPPLGGFDPLPELLSGTVELAGAANDALSGLQSLELSFSMGYQWQEITPSNDRWTYEWDTTQTNGGYKRLYLRLTDKAGNTYTTSVDVLVSNVLPQAEITPEWVITESGQVRITPGDLPIRQVCLTIQDAADESRKVEWCGDSIEDIPNPVQWDGKFADGTQAVPGQYPVTVQVTDIAGRTVTASGTVIIPAPTPTPTAEEREEATATKPLVIAVLPTATQTPTATPTQTPTEEEREEPTDTPPPAVSMVLPTPQPTVKPPKFEVQAAVEAVRRALWPFLTLIGLAAALGYSAMRDERPKAIRRLAERMEQIKELQEVK
jgi:LysM repeat protein